MKKGLLLSITLLASISFQPKISCAQKVPRTIEVTARVTGTVTGAVAGAIGGTVAAHALELEGLTGMAATATPAIVSSAIGAEIGQYLGEKAAVLYISKRYSVDKRIALALLISKQPINKETIALFQAAEKKDTQFLREIFTTYYSKLFGNQWYTIVSSLINKAIQYKVASEFRLHFQGILKARKFILSTPVSYAVATLYFDKPFPRRRNFKNFAEMTKQLFDELFAEQEAVPSPSE